MLTHNWNVSNSEAEVQGQSELRIQDSKKKENRQSKNKQIMDKYLCSLCSWGAAQAAPVSRVLGVQSYWLRLLVDPFKMPFFLS